MKNMNYLKETGTGDETTFVSEMKTARYTMDGTDFNAKRS
ncbi:hypothetical protein Metlim_1426 [Methanoplanus limicola DSM 2279]|uniref:Uncharacterized protein n=1 Tax=Methanoplanus limicola DSM 2279 TaxID=937775 RepID=H1Z2K3_9EURY|nr:hypothetical protein Metlim_1426 [Methanoplanus limicola DSM 2279]